MSAQSDAIERYIAHGHTSVQGWLFRIDAEIFRAVLAAQYEHTPGGAVAEIGVHHGKSFLPLCLSLRDQERAFCLDVFEDQHLNLDRSGLGDRRRLEQNLGAFDVPLDRVVIRKASSFDIDGADVLAAVGPVRFFSVDGGHWQEIARNDMLIAEQCLAPHGVIALDDFHRPDWPGVSAGYFAWWHDGRTRPLVPFAIGRNKLFICHELWVSTYQRAVSDDPFLRRFIRKKAEFQGQEVLVLADGHPSTVMEALRTNRPEMYATLDAVPAVRKIVRRLSRWVRR
jgi:hypothetical protein